MLNVSRVLQSKNFSQNFKVYRKKGHLLKGELIQSEDILTFKGVVTVASPKELNQVPEGDRISGMMVFYSQNEIRITRAGGIESQDTFGTSDELEWQGKRYKVLKVNPYVDYGYFKAFATYMEGI